MRDSFTRSQVTTVAVILTLASGGAIAMAAPASASTCTTSTATGACGPYHDSNIVGSDGRNTYALQDVWNPPSGFTGETCETGSATPCQTVTVSSAGSWSAEGNYPAGNTAALAYPDTQQIYTTSGGTPNPLTNFGSLVSSWNHTDPRVVSGNSYDIGYDIWTGTNSSNDWGWEQMIWTDQYDRGGSGANNACGGATLVATDLQFGGSYGVPVQDWDLCRNGAAGQGQELVWYLPSGEETSGSVDILQMLTWEENNGYIPQGSGLTAIDYGIEWYSTGGNFERFSLNSFSITSPSS